jgi:LysM repeat protein
MQYDDGNGYSDFWGDDQPTRQLRRVQPAGRGRSHHAGDEPTRVLRRTEPQAESTRPTRRIEVLERPARQRASIASIGAVDPLIRRLGMVVAAIVVLIPAAIALRNEPAARVQSAPTSVAEAVEAFPAATPAPQAVSPAINPADLPPAVPVAEAEAPSTSYYIAAELPPAVPVVSQPASTEAATASTQAAAPTTATTTPAAAPAGEGSGTACAKTYVVAKGDFWISIAKRAQVTLKQLLKANNAKTSTKLFPGRTICLPSNAVTPVPAAQPATTTTVKPAKPAPAPAPAPAPSTTVKPPSTSTPAAPAPPNSYSREQVIQIIREVWPDDLEEEAIRIATRESSLKPNVRNFCCFGLFQIYFSVHKSWLAGLGVTSAEQLYDPRVNATAALALYVRAGGWGPWKL